MPATNDTLLPFSLPTLRKKKVTAAFDGGQISSDGGVFLLAAADTRLGLIDALAALIPDHRNTALVTHPMADMLRERIFAIACGYPDANDLDHLREDPAFKMACGRLPESGVDLASQPTMSRLENVPDLRTLIRMSRGMVDLWCESHRKAPKSIILDIDDTADPVHGHQQLSLFNAHYDERCFLPIHIYDAETGHCVLTILRPGRPQMGARCGLICAGWSGVSACTGQNRSPPTSKSRPRAHSPRRRRARQCLLGACIPNFAAVPPISPRGYSAR